MKTPIEKQYEKWVRGMFNKYKSILFIEKYELYFKKSEEHYLASKFHFPYLNITIEYSNRAVKNWKEDKNDAECEIIHEFLHVVTDPLYNLTYRQFKTKDEVEEVRENLNDHITKMVFKFITPHISRSRKNARK